MLSSNLNDLAEPHYGRGKRIRFWKNGDPFSECYVIHINPNLFRSWNSVLAYLTEYINPEFGAVHKVYCLKTGKAVCCFDQLDPNEKYIVAGKGRLLRIKNGYLTTSETEMSLRPKEKRLYSADFDPERFKFLEETSKRGLTIIFLLVSGRPCQKPAKIVLTELDCESWENTLRFLAKVADLPDGILYICTIFGDILYSPYELQHGYVYVAVPFGEKFKYMDYMAIFGRFESKVYTIALNLRPSTTRRSSKAHKLQQLQRLFPLERSNFPIYFKKSKKTGQKKRERSDPGPMTSQATMENPIERRIKKICGSITPYCCSSKFTYKGTPEIIPRRTSESQTVMYDSIHKAPSPSVGIQSVGISDRQNMTESDAETQRTDSILSDIAEEDTDAFTTPPSSECNKREKSQDRAMGSFLTDQAAPGASGLNQLDSLKQKSQDRAMGSFLTDPVAPGAAGLNQPDSLNRAPCARSLSTQRVSQNSQDRVIGPIFSDQVAPGASGLKQPDSSKCASFARSHSYQRPSQIPRDGSPLPQRLSSVSKVPRPRSVSPQDLPKVPSMIRPGPVNSKEVIKPSLSRPSANLKTPPTSDARPVPSKEACKTTRYSANLKTPATSDHRPAASKEARKTTLTSQTKYIPSTSDVGPVPSKEANRSTLTRHSANLKTPPTSDPRPVPINEAVETNLTRYSANLKTPLTSDPRPVSSNETEIPPTSDIGLVPSKEANRSTLTRYSNNFKIPSMPDTRPVPSKEANWSSLVNHSTHSIDKSAENSETELKNCMPTDEAASSKTDKTSLRKSSGQSPVRIKSQSEICKICEDCNKCEEDCSVNPDTCPNFGTRTFFSTREDIPSERFTISALGKKSISSVQSLPKSSSPDCICDDDCEHCDHKCLEKPVGKISFAKVNQVIPLPIVEEHSDTNTEENSNKTSWKNLSNINEIERKSSEDPGLLPKTSSTREPKLKIGKTSVPESDGSKEAQTDTSFIKDSLKGFENVKIKYYEQRVKYTQDREGTIKRVVEIFTDYGNKNCTCKKPSASSISGDSIEL